jgi:DNA-directed RNA polymerase specialized sigma subunit
MKMSDEARKAYNQHQRNWKRKNPDKVRQYIVNYWERKAKQPQNIEKLVVDLHYQGKSLRDIGQAVGLSHMKVKRMLQRVTTVTKDNN